MKKVEKKAELKVEKRGRWQWLVEPQSVFIHPPGELFSDSIVFILLALATYLVADYLYAVNFVFFFIRWGSLALLVLTVATLVYALKMIAHLIHGIARLRKQYKFLIFLLIIIGALLVIINRDAIMPQIISLLWTIPWGNLNPLAFWGYPYPYYWT